MTIDWTQIILWGLIIAVVIVVLAALWKIIRLAILFVAALGAFTLIADKLYGGTALEQIAERITDWIKSRFGS